jgi:hypothetical protein
MVDRSTPTMTETKPPWTICKAAMWDMESRLRRALGPNFDIAPEPVFFLPETGIERAFAAIAPNLECCQPIVFMI